MHARAGPRVPSPAPRAEHSSSAAQQRSPVRRVAVQSNREDGNSAAGKGGVVTDEWAQLGLLEYVLRLCLLEAQNQCQHMDLGVSQCPSARQASKLVQGKLVLTCSCCSSQLHQHM